MKPRSRKNKGRRLQNKVAKDLADLLDLEYGKEKDIWSRLMGESGPDIVIAKHVRNKVPLSIECKNQEKWNILEFYKQAVDQAYEDTEPIVVISKNRLKEPFVIIRWEFFKFLLKNWLRGS